MKQSTAEQKLMELLGIKDVEPSHAEPEKPKARAKAKPGDSNAYAFTAVEEVEIQSFRAIQGFLYYLQAPKLFTYLKCRECHEPFMVSRRNVAFCSYNCIAKNCESQGFVWNKGMLDLEVMVNDTQLYNGNEPIWIRQPEKVLDALITMFELVERDNKNGAIWDDAKSKLIRMKFDPK